MCHSFYDRRPWVVRDLCCGPLRVYLELELRRVACPECGKVKRERLPWLANNPFYTKRFAFYVGRRCRDSTIKAVASLSAQKEILRFLNRYRCKDGTYRWLEWNSYPDGNLIYAVARDVTERKNVESALRETEGLYRTIFQTSPDGIVLLDLEGRITFASPKTLQVIGVAAIEEVTGRSIDDFIAPDDHARVHAAFERVLNEQYYSSSEYTVRRPDGSSFIGEFNAALLRDAEGRQMAAANGVVEIP